MQAAGCPVRCSGSLFSQKNFKIQKKIVQSLQKYANIEQWFTDATLCISYPMWGISAAGSAPHWQCGGQGFESPMLHQIENLTAVSSAVIFLRRFLFRRWQADTGRNPFMPCSPLFAKF